MGAGDAGNLHISLGRLLDLDGVGAENIGQKISPHCLDHVHGLGGVFACGRVAQQHGLAGLVPLHLHIQDIADGADGHIGASVIGDGIKADALGVFQHLLFAVILDGDAGVQVSLDLLQRSGGCGAHRHARSQGGSQQSGKSRFFDSHKHSSIFWT